jgi:hypothetical protein
MTTAPRAGRGRKPKSASQKLGSSRPKGRRLDTLALSVVRPEDLLDLRFELVNLRLAEGAVLVRVDPAAEAHVVVHFAAQHLGEEVFPELDDGSPSPPEPPVAAVLAGPSRLAFQVPPELAELPLTLEGLLSWHLLKPSLAPNALRAEPFTSSSAAPAPPEPLATAIEAPYRLMLSPGHDGRWAHATEAVTRSGWTELWHTRLVGRGTDGTAEGPAVDRTVRAIWSPDVTGAPPSGVPMSSLSPQDRREFVRLSGDFSLTPLGHPRPRAITTNRLMLSSLGAWLDLAGDWELMIEPEAPLDDEALAHDLEDQWEEAQTGGEDPDVALQQVADRFANDFPPEQRQAVRRAIYELVQRLGGGIADSATRLLAALQLLPSETLEWRHRAAQGRDTYVRVSVPGHLFPLGHRVTLVKAIERKLQPDPHGALTAFLRQRTYIVVNEAFRDYGALAGAYQHALRESPFLSARLVDAITPSLDPAPQGEAFFPTINGADFKWSVAFEDQDGRPVHLSMPLLFVPTIDANGVRFDPGRAQQVYAEASQRSVDGAGQGVSFTPSANTRPDQAVLVANSLTFGAQVETAAMSQLPAGHPRFLPSIEMASVQIPAVDALLGPAKPTRGTRISYDPAYLASGFDEAVNKGQLFAKVEDAIDVAFAPQRAGGLARPDMAIGALSRMLGPVGDRDNILNGVFDAKRLLPDAKILGGISLKELLAPVVSGLTPQQLPDLSGLDPKELWKRLEESVPVVAVPAFTQRTLRSGGVPTAVETQYVWKPQLHVGQVPGVTFITLPAGASLTLVTTLRAPLDGSEPVFESRGELAGFAIDFAGVVEVRIAKLGFRARGASKLDVTAEDVDLTFKGELAFVNVLRDFIPSDGFSDPPAISVTPQGISAHYGLGLPSIGVGVFSLQNIGLSATLTLPFTDGSAGLRFRLSERHDPFLVTVSLFGGGGFFALGVRAGGQLEVEAAIEFGGNFSLDIVVASGGVHVMAGVYLKLTGSDVQLTGYLRAGGSLTVLGLITVSVEFYLALAYESATDKVWGEASLTVGVEVLFFSTSVTLHVKREFAGSAGDPTFDELVEPDDWATYCGAFAA